MADAKPSGRRFNMATFALVAAALLAAVAIGIAVFRSDEEAAAPANSIANAAADRAGSMEDMLAALLESVRRNPDDHQAWFRLGFAYRNNRQFADAERAFRRAGELAPRNADYLAYLGEVLLLIAGDTPPPEATTLFRRVLEIQPGNPQARYYLATIRDIGGDHRGAVDDLIALLRDAPPGAPWEPQVREAVTAIAGANDIDIAARLPPPRAPPESTATAGIPGPTREQMEAARAISPGEQDEMVKGMVDRLAARLRQNPRDAEGWIRLMRSRMVLNDPRAAGEALGAGLTAFRNDAATQARIRGAARELGVPGAS